MSLAWPKIGRGASFTLPAGILRDFGPATKGANHFQLPAGLEEPALVVVQGYRYVP